MRRLTLYIISTLLILSSCSEKDDWNNESGGTVELTFAVDVPEATDVTRAYDDNSIRSLDLLVFDASNQFVERIPVNSISGAGATKTFSARFTASTTQRTIHVIANARGDNNNDIISFNSITSGTPQSSAIPGLVSGILSAGQSPELPFVMWGRVVLSSITTSTAVSSPIKMLRMAASMYVTCDTPTPENGLNNFVLTSFSVANASDRGQVAPTAYTAEASTPSVPTLPSGVSLVNYAMASNGTWAPAVAGATSELYLYDKQNTGAATDLKIIIRASWNGVDGYYPVWMSDGSATRVNVVRNHRYKVTVKGVYGTGYTELSDALNAEPSTSNIGVTITDDNADMTDVITDGKYKLGLASNQVAISGSGAKTVTAVMKTNGAVTLTGTADVAWITGFSFTPSGAERWTLSATFGSTATVRTGTITVRAGNLTRTVHVTQNP